MSYKEMWTWYPLGLSGPPVQRELEILDDQTVSNGVPARGFVIVGGTHSDLGEVNPARVTWSQKNETKVVQTTLGRLFVKRLPI